MTVTVSCKQCDSDKTIRCELLLFTAMAECLLFLVSDIRPADLSDCHPHS